MENNPIINLADHTAEWLSGSGPMAEIVISSRVRYARNLAGSLFLTRASEKDQANIEKIILEAVAKSELADKLQVFQLIDTSSVDRLFLVERHLISKELAGASGARAVAFTHPEDLAVMVNEEDHLRIQVLKSGLQLKEAWRDLNSVDDALGKHLDYAFSTQYGYLTACPTNVGTGIRVSVMLHLPALAMTKQIEKVFQAMAKINLAVRGYYGERTQALGDFYQISNQVTLGRDEETIVESLAGVIPQVINYEQRVRETLLTENRHNLEDRIWRAYGTLKFARTITSEEAMDLLSAVRMGVNLGIISDVPLDIVNNLFLRTQPAHLQKMEKKSLTASERDAARAAFIRDQISKAPEKPARKKGRTTRKTSGDEPAGEEK
jgi:protein arginine kinase